MFKYIRFYLVISCLVLPLLAQAKADFVFTAQPTFTNLCCGDIQSGDYTIRNDFPKPVKIQDIEIISSDALPATASAIVAAPTNSCVEGTHLASGATCNIRLNLQPLVPGDYNRKLRVAFDTRQVEIFGSAITSTVDPQLACSCLDYNDTPFPEPDAETMDACWDDCCLNGAGKYHAARFGKYTDNCKS